MQDGALGNGGAFVSAPFGRPPGQRTAGQTLKPPVLPLPKTRICRRPARHDCPGRHRNPAHEDPGGIREQAAGHRAPGNLLRAEQTLLEPRLATAPGRTACILIRDPPARDAPCRDELRRDRRVCGWSGYEDDGPLSPGTAPQTLTAPTHLNLRPAPGHSALWRLDARTSAISAVRYADGDDGGVGYDRSYEEIMCACLEHSARQTPGSWPMLATHDAADRDQRVAGGADGPIGGQL